MHTHYAAIIPGRWESRCGIGFEQVLSAALDKSCFYFEGIQYYTLVFVPCEPWVAICNVRLSRRGHVCRADCRTREHGRLLGQDAFTVTVQYNIEEFAGQSLMDVVNHGSCNSSSADCLSSGTQCSIFLMNPRKRALFFPSRFSSDSSKVIVGIFVAPFQLPKGAISSNDQ